MPEIKPANPVVVEVERPQMNAQTDERRMVCDACGNGRTKRIDRMSNAQWEIVACQHCGFVFLSNPPAIEALEDEFAWEQMMAGRREKRDSLARTAIAKIRRACKAVRGNKLKSLVSTELAGGMTIDLGCGSGSRWDDLPDRYIPVGIEIEPEPAQLAHQRFMQRGGRCEHGGAVEVLDSMPAHSADGAILRAYLEHEPNPAAVLCALARVLKPGSRVLIKVPNYGSVNAGVQGTRWCGWRLPEHVNYFEPKTLTQMLERQGFSLVRFGFFDRLPFSDNMWAVFER